MENYHLLRRSFTSKPPVPVYGKGAYLYLENGERVIDSSGGAAVLSIGHGVEEIGEAMKQQANTLCYVTPANFTNQPAENLANEIVTEKYEKMGFSKVMFVNSGSEANENAYKMLRQYYYDKGQYQRVNVIGRDIAYHGNTIMTLQLSGTPHRKAPYEDVLNYDKFHKVSSPHPTHLKHKEESDDDYVDRLINELEAKFHDLGPETVMGVYFEPIIGTSAGCAIPPKGYLKRVKSMCEKYGAMLVYDEVICGSGRCGKYFFAWEHLIDEGDTWEDIVPDIVTVGKSLSGGYSPLSGLIIQKKFSDNFISNLKTFISGHTFQSHAVSCAAGLAVQKYIKRNNLLENVHEQGKYLGELLKSELDGLVCVVDVRGIGFLWTVEMVRDKTTMEEYPPGVDFGGLVFRSIFNHGVSVYSGKGSIDGKKGVSFLVSPPYNSSKEEIEEIVGGIRRGIEGAVEEADKVL